MTANNAILHLYPSPYGHANAWVVGNREGLEKLQAAIDAALKERVANDIVEAEDGESYSLFVVRHDEIGRAEELLLSPYAKTGSDTGIHPVFLIGLDTYMKMCKRLEDEMPE